MKKYLKQIFTFVLCFALCIGSLLPAQAANEKGITYSVALDKAEIAKTGVAQTVVMTLSASEAITTDSITLDVTMVDSGNAKAPFTISAITSGDNTEEFSPAELNLETGKVTWSSDDAKTVSGIEKIAEVTFVIPADVTAGTYTVGIAGLVLSDNFGSNVWENGGSASTTLTITEEAAAEGYTAGISAENLNVEVGNVVKIPVAVTHDEEATFNACEIKVSYDNSVLTFSEEKSTLGTMEGVKAGVKAENGVLTLEDYGEAKTCGTSVYVLAFDATAAASNSKVELTYAAFNNATNAETKDLTVAAALFPASVTLNIANAALAVSIDSDMFTGEATVAYGDDYTFSLAENGEYYDYTDISATMDGQPATVLDNNDGTYTIENVTGVLEITAERTPKTFPVTFEGTGGADAADVDGNATSATYLTGYTFKMPADTTENYYELGSITIGGAAYTDYTVSSGVYTIPGADVKGDVVFNIIKTAIPTDSVKVTIEGTGAGVASGTTTIKKGEAYTLTLNPEAGYQYEVTAIMGGETATVVDNEDNTYTINNVSGAIVFTVTRSVDRSGVSVSSEKYVKVDGLVVWLVTNTTEVADGKVPTYDGQKMFWSDKYNGGQGAYCYLVVADTLSVDDAMGKLDIASGTKTAVDYGMDVNMTGKVDASDAQLTYNIYNAMYNGFTETVTMEKYLRADVNADAVINVNDAAAIVTNILNPTTAN